MTKFLFLCAIIFGVTLACATMTGAQTNTKHKDLIPWNHNTILLNEQANELEIYEILISINYWHSPSQQWLNWFRDGEGLGVNTLDRLIKNEVYFVTAEEYFDREKFDIQVDDVVGTTPQTIRSHSFAITVSCLDSTPRIVYEIPQGRSNTFIKYKVGYTWNVDPTIGGFSIHPNHQRYDFLKAKEKYFIDNIGEEFTLEYFLAGYDEDNPDTTDQLLGIETFTFDSREHLKIFKGIYQNCIPIIEETPTPTPIPTPTPVPQVNCNTKWTEYEDRGYVVESCYGTAIKYYTVTNKYSSTITETSTNTVIPYHVTIGTRYHQDFISHHAISEPTRICFVSGVDRKTANDICSP